MSPFGIFHTAISVLPIGFGLAALIRDGKIDPRTRLGKWYIGTMLAASVSSWGFVPEKGFNVPQALTLLTLATLVVAMLTARFEWRRPGVVQTLALSASYFLLWFFTTTEMLTRVPVGSPFASGPNDPALLPVRLALLTALGVGGWLQVRAERRAMPGMPRPAMA